MPIKLFYTFLFYFVILTAQGNVLAVYEHKHAEGESGTFTLAEQHLYGASRIGMTKPNLALNTTMPEAPVPTIHYELTNHLGNVMAVITDEPATTETPMVESLTDYYPFGMTMPGRSYNVDAERYRYGFQRQEREQELWGGESSFFTYRISDNRLGRFFSVDPVSSKFPWNSSYAFSVNRLIDAVELEGLEAVLILHGGSREDNPKGISDNRTFNQAAKKYKEHYNKNKEKLGIKGSIDSYKILNGKDIVNKINNSQEEIVRLDIITHSTPISINTSEKPFENNGLYISRIKNLGLVWEYSEFENHEIYTFKDAISYEEINFDKFANDAIIEFHGCLTGYDLVVLDNLAEEFSEKLSEAGKNNAVVIAHREKSSPNKNRSYRNGSRVVYHNGKVLMETREDGDITKIIKEELSSKFKTK